MDYDNIPAWRRSLFPYYHRTYQEFTFHFRRRLFGENDLNCLGHLPEKLKTELALHVHLETLKKVSQTEKNTILSNYVNY